MQKSKSVIRKEILEKRNRLSREQRIKADRLMKEHIMNHPWFVCSDKILCYISYGSEMNTTEILSEALRLGKRVYVPKVTDADRSLMEFYEICSTDELVTGYKGIPEPVGNSLKYRYESNECVKTLLLMPGVAFDDECNRIGYGKGFYDRFLEQKEELRKRSIGIGYACQMIEKIPSEANDIKPNSVICF